MCLSHSTQTFVPWTLRGTLTGLLLIPPRLDSIKVSLLQQLNSTFKVIHCQQQRLLLMLGLHGRMQQSDNLRERR